MAMADLGYHILLEKPISTTWESTFHVLQAVRKAGRLVALGLVLRYTPFNLLLKKLLSEEKAVGKILQIQHTERVGWWHFAHSYVRGNWRNSGKDGGIGAPTLLTKCCHDMDLLFWLLDENPARAEPQQVDLGDRKLPDNSTRTSGVLPTILPNPVTIYSTGSVSVFKKENKPPNAGDYCLTCPIEQSCLYSAKKIYLQDHLGNPFRGTGWPISVLVPEIEEYDSYREASAAVVKSLSPSSSKNYGRCVWGVPDNDVCDNQSVSLTFSGGVVVNLNMVAFSGAITQRHTSIYGTHGELHADTAKKRITIHSFIDDAEREYVATGAAPNGMQDAHDGGDYGLMKSFVEAIWRVERENWKVDDAQKEVIGAEIDEFERSHRAIWLAEKSREEGKIVDWSDGL